MEEILQTLSEPGVRQAAVFMGGAVLGGLGRIWEMKKVMEYGGPEIVQLMPEGDKRLMWIKTKVVRTLTTIIPTVIGIENSIGSDSRPVHGNYVVEGASDIAAAYLGSRTGAYLISLLGSLTGSLVNSKEGYNERKERKERQKQMASSLGELEIHVIHDKNRR